MVKDQGKKMWDEFEKKLKIYRQKQLNQTKALKICHRERIMERK